MGSKASGNHYTSKGGRSGVSKKIRNAMRSDRVPAEKMINIQRAWVQGSNPWMTIENPNKEQTNKKFIRVRVRDQKGTYKDYMKNMKPQ